MDVKRAFAQYGHSPIFQRRIEQADAADELWRKAQTRVALLLQQIVADYERGALAHVDAITPTAPEHESSARVGNGSALFAFLLDLIR